MGWVCERLCTGVVAKMGIQISDDLNLYNLKVQHFTRIPDVSHADMKVGYGIVYIPNRYNFGSVDAVIVYKDMLGNFHFIGLQFTTSLDRHKHSEEQFMNVAVLEKWIPSILQQLQGWQLHYTFICMTSKDKVKCPSNIRQLKNGVCFGTVEHTLHVQSFADALGQHRVGNEVFQLLQEMTKKREEENADPKPSTEEFLSQCIFPVEYSSAAIKRVTGARLRSLASVSGKLNPDHYKTRDLLIDAMKSAGLLIVS
ncbi:hypothetical protein GOP47_0001315 [Adiantum capillus-veneris]|uniref:Uncharacterized protein n=1 Tax=Adiantum capillus-veneris TaxID=13818 RepID=A0A9D4V8M4_ADICA|nr:hypothetical protein GOP47_0001315 [Adiantum capillus-veneris]